METTKPSSGPESVPFSSGFLKSIRARLLILLLIVIIPILAVQANTFRQRIKGRIWLETQGNLEIARATGERFYFFIKEVLRDGSTTGRLLLSPHLRAPARIELIKGMAGLNPIISHTHWINPQGRIILSSLSEAFGRDRWNRPYLQDVLSGKEWVLSDLFRSELTGAPVFSVSQAIRNEGGALAGIVVTVILADRLDEVLKIERPRNGSINLVDRQGKRVFQYPKGGLIWEKRQVWNNASLVSEALAGKDVTATVDVANEGVRKIVAFSPIPPLGWVAGAGRPEEEVMASIFSDQFNHSALFLVVVFGSTLAALAFSRGISVPVKRLREQALALGCGNLGGLVRIGGPAELEDLGRTMNRMAEELFKSKEQMLENADRILRQKEALLEANEQLEMRVQERTAELLKVNAQLRDEVKERRIKEKAYKQLSHKNELILNAAEEGIFGVDPHGIITFVNPTAARLMGVEIEELLNQQIHELSHH
ncbi:MAG TPA: cache domain-containing protein, partial [Thermodesulfobacteriota bacterium]|nr:cache domain-containing protein [Thermodesulfobacteriota bacterium]